MPYDKALNTLLLHTHAVDELSVVLDTRYVQKAGDTMSGALVLSGASSNLTVGGHAALGAAASISADNILSIMETLNDAANNVFGVNLTVNVTAVTTKQVIGLQFLAQSNIASGTVNTLGGMFGGAQTLFGENITTLYGGYFQPEHLGTGTITNAYGMQTRIENLSTGIITTAYGIAINAAVNSGGGTITTNYGLYLADQTVGGTNYGIYTGAGQNFFGDTVNIPYGSYFGVNRGENWSSGTHKLIGTSWNGSNDETDIFTPGGANPNPVLSLTSANKCGVGNVIPSGNGILQVRAGNQTTNIAQVGGVIFDHYADANSSSTNGTFDDLYSDTTPASLLNTNGEKIIAEYGGIFVASGTATRDIKVLFAGTTILDTSTLTTATADSWDIRVLIIRESSTVVRCQVSIVASTTLGAQAFNDTTYTRITGLTLTGTNILKVQGAAAGVGAAASDIVAKLGTISFMPAA